MGDLVNKPVEEFHKHGAPGVLLGVGKVHILFYN
jgi:hypothetical protein